MNASAPALAAETGPHLELALTGMLIAVSALVTLARVLSVPYPIFLVLGGLALSAIPGAPHVALEPDLVLLIFLPPLLYVTAFFGDVRGFRENARAIGLLSIGLVLATCVAVAAVAHTLIDGLSWSAAFTLGAILGPTDPVAATSMASRLGLPRRVVVVAEGESLINDATALVAYRVAVGAVVSGGFEFVDAAGEFALTASGGVAIGVVVAWAMAQVRQRIEDPPVEITLSLLTGYVAYLPAEELGVSGVVAAVSAGIFLGLRASRLQAPTTRLQAYAVWEIVTFLLNSALFLLIGLQLPRILDALEGDQQAELIGDALVIAAVVIVVRLTWTFVFAYLPRWLFPRIAEREERPPERNVAVVAWMGMRGAVSLAAALALPVTIDGGGPFPARDAILLITFVVILVTLCLQGLTLPAVIRLLGIEPDDDGGTEEARARLHVTTAALERIEALEVESWTLGDSIDNARRMYAYRHKRFSARLDDPDGASQPIEERSAQWLKIMRTVIEAQREAIYDLHARGEVGDATMRRLERDLDLEQAHFLEQDVRR